MVYFECKIGTWNLKASYFGQTKPWPGTVISWLQSKFGEVFDFEFHVKVKNELGTSWSPTTARGLQSGSFSYLIVHGLRLRNLLLLSWFSRTPFFSLASWQDQKLDPFFGYVAIVIVFLLVALFIIFYEKGKMMNKMMSGKRMSFFLSPYSLFYYFLGFKDMEDFLIALNTVIFPSHSLLEMDFVVFLLLKVLLQQHLDQ